MAREASKTVRVNIPLTPVVKEAVVQYAKKSRRSMARFMSEAIAEKVLRLQKDEQDRDLRAAYREYSEELLQDVNEWDHLSQEAWDRAGREGEE